MFGDFDKYIVVFLTGLLVTYLLTPVVRSLATRFGVVDKPDARRPHKRITARGGGLAAARERRRGQGRLAILHGRRAGKAQKTLSNN